MSLRSILKKAAELDASDLHLVTGMPACLRVSGEITFMEGEALSDAEISAMLAELMNAEQKARFERDWQVCFSCVFEDIAHIRVSLYKRMGKVEAAIRLRHFELRTLEALGLPPIVAELTRSPNGLVLITGSTGVGKTTTLYAMIDRINREQRSILISVEDPIEYLHTPKRSVILQQEIGRDTKNFQDALMHILRLDPDVICIGEMRDMETIATTLLAAETGHLVIATLHTTGAAQTVDRIISAFPAHERAGIAAQLSHCLRGVITQLLLPTADKKGLTLAYEVMTSSTAVRNNIAEMRVSHLGDSIQSGLAEGMKSLDISLRDLYLAGKITYDTAMAHVRNPKVFSGLTPPAGPGGAKA